jgi:LAGLIDADG endonuclease
MATLSPKYIAGFLDADGTVNIVFQADTKRPQLRLGFCQKTSQDEVLQLIHAEWGGHMQVRAVKGVEYSHLTWSGNKQCSMLLNRIKQFLVIKRHYAEVCLDVSERQIEKDEIPKIREYLKIQRRQKSLPLPKHPSRKWLAGYIDGDGCISVTQLRKPSGVADLVLHIAASNYDTEGIEIIQKQFGGRINDMCEGRVKQFAVSLAPSKAKEIFDEIVPSMIVKRDQAEFILKCAAMGHLRDGESIKAALKHLKAHPHRLSEPKPDVHALFKEVRDLPKYERDPEGLRQSAAKMNAVLADRRAMR